MAAGVLHSLVRLVWLLGIFCCGQALLHAEVQTRGFEASIKKSGPDGTYIEGRLFASGPELRIETRTPRGIRVSLMNRDSLKLIDMDPESRTYRETQVTEELKPLFGIIRCNHELPCLKPSASDCVALGDTMVNGRLASRWISTKGPGGYRQQWVDLERGWVLRSHTPGLKAQMSLRFIGLESLEGRLVEKWERRQEIAFQPPQVSWFWYDRTLELAVREEWLGGYVQAISNIRPGVQPGWLFEVPAEYRRIGSMAPLLPQTENGSQQSGTTE
jgi:hypothetical protein